MFTFEQLLIYSRQLRFWFESRSEKIVPTSTSSSLFFWEKITMQKIWNFLDLHCLQKSNQFTPWHCTNLIFKFLIYTQMLRFSRKSLQNLVVHDFTLLLTPFWVQINRLVKEESIFEDLAKDRKYSILLTKWPKRRFHRTFKWSVLVT